MTLTNTTIENLKEQVNNSKTYEKEGRQLICDLSKKLYSIIEKVLYNKYGQNAIKDAYSDLIEGNFAEPFMCEKQKEKFVLYSNIYTRISQS